MATWVTHLIVADKVLARLPELDRRGFCVGSIAPDCNVENEDWTAFTPPREVTHWMSGDKKVPSDCEGFLREYLINRRNQIRTNEHYSFLLGYCAHLIADAEFQRFIRDGRRVHASWERICGDPRYAEAASGYAESWDSVKRMIPRAERMREIYSMEAEYLAANPGSGYMEELLPLKEFPDYIDYLPHGCIVRKLSVMGYMPEADAGLSEPLTMSRAEFRCFAQTAAELTVGRLSGLPADCHPPFR